MSTRNRFRPRVEELEGRLVPSSLSYSTNWSGYAVSTGAGAVSQVAATWTVPAVSTNVSGYSSAWVGIDGWSSSSVEQIGTDSDYVNGKASYYAWYEMYPADSVNLSLSIHVGDTISALVSTSSPGQFLLSITNVTTDQSFSTTQTSTQAQLSSAEWIQEAPSSIGGVLPLANFGTINFSGANATVNGTTGPADNAWSGTTLNQINMVTKTLAPKATTSALTDSGSPLTSSFSVTWVSSGASGKGGGHKSTNVPTGDSSPTTPLFLATAPASVATAQMTSPVLTTTLSSTVALPASILVAAPPAARPASATFPLLVLEAGNPDVQTADAVNLPDAPLPAQPAQPRENGPASPADGRSTPPADQPPAEGGGAILEQVWASEADLASRVWLPPAALQSATDRHSGGRAGQDVALAGLVLLFALDHTWVDAMPPHDRTRRKARGRWERMDSEQR
jgi:hypothetical protein